jgi:hypothetical protein
LCKKCHAKHFIQGTIEGRIEVTGRRGRRRYELLDFLKKKREYWKLKNKHYFALCGKLALEEVMEPLYEKLWGENLYLIYVEVSLISLSVAWCK